MLAFLYALVALPMATATFWTPTVVPVCGTNTVWCTKTTTVQGPNPTTITCTKGDWGCTATTTVTRDRTDCTTKTITSTKTNTPTCYVTGTPTKTVTRTVCAATKTVCSNHLKRADIPKEWTNAKRLEMGLPVRTLEEEEEAKRWLYPPKPSCTPTCVTSTKWLTKTNNQVTVTSTSCYNTRTNTVYNTKSNTITSTCWRTINGPATTITRECIWPATTTIRTTATITKSCWYKREEENAPRTPAAIPAATAA